MQIYLFFWFIYLFFECEYKRIQMQIYTTSMQSHDEVIIDQSILYEVVMTIYQCFLSVHNLSIGHASSPSSVFKTMDLISSWSVSISWLAFTSCREKKEWEKLDSIRIVKIFAHDDLGINPQLLTKLGSLPQGYRYSHV